MSLQLARINTLSSSADSIAGAGRGVDKVFQFLDSELERRIGVAIDKLGSGPEATKRRALAHMKKLRRYTGYVEFPGLDEVLLRV